METCANNFLDETSIIGNTNIILYGLFLTPPPSVNTSRNLRTSPNFNTHYKGNYVESNIFKVSLGKPPLKK